MEGITPTYNLADRGYDGFGGGSGLWLFAILALLNGGFGWNNRGIDGRVATVEDLNNTSNFARLESQVQGIGSDLASGFRNVDNGIATLGYEVANHFGSLSKEVAECCCGINRNIDAVRYENALNTSAINANTTAQTQKILDAISQSKIESLQAQVNKLELQNAFCGVVKYPTSATFASACNPFFNGCNNY